MSIPNEKSINLLLSFINSTRAVDMSHAMELGMPNWPTQPPYSYTDYNRLDWGDESFHRGVSFSEHTGTHVDAGAHFVPGAPTIDQYPLHNLLGRGVNVDATMTPPRGDYPLEQLKAWEGKNGEIKEGDLVFFRFGWDSLYGIKPNGKGFCHDWPGTSVEVGEYLREKRVKAVGTDTMALDADGSTYPCHTILLGNGIYILENVNNLAILPTFFTVMGFPLPFKDGSASPLRLVAFVDKD